MKTLHAYTLKSILAVGAVMTLGACAGNWDVDSVGAMPDKGSAFQSALHKEYSDLARMERDESDWTDASFFNSRAMAAANGETFAPQDTSARNLPQHMVLPMAATRGKLVKALEAGADAQPAVAARAQAMFDCWMQEQEENFQPDDIAKCRGEFESAMAKLASAPMKPMKKAMPAKKPMAPSFTIYFGFDSAELSATGVATVKEAAEYAMANKGKLVVLKGHADRAGDNAYNVMLSERRAEATANALTAAGVNASNIMREGHGEFEPAVPTDDGAQNAENRRVVIQFSK